MSISTNSTNSGDFSSNDCEMNYDELSLVKEEAVVKKNGESFTTDRQQLKELSEKFAKMELVLENTKLELKNKGLQEKLKQHKTNAQLTMIEAENRKMENEIEKMQTKLEKKEEQHMNKFEQLQKDIFIAHQQQNELVGQIKQVKDEQKNYLARADELEKEQKHLQQEKNELKNAHKEMQENMNKLEEILCRKLDAKALQEGLEKKQLLEQIVTVQAKVGKIEMENQQQKVSIDQIEKLQNEQNKKNQCIGKRTEREAYGNDIFKLPTKLLGCQRLSQRTQNH